MTKHKNNFDYNLFFYIFLLMIFSCICMYSAQQNALIKDEYLLKQIAWFIIGLIIVLCIFYFDFEAVMKLTPIAYIIGILMLISVLLAPNTIAPVRNGAKSWFVIKGIGSIQPSEFMKIFLILMLSYVIARHRENHSMTILASEYKLMLKIGVLSLIPISLTYLQNDFGTSLVMVIITLGMIFLSINWRIDLLIFISGIIIIASLTGIFLINPQLLLKVFDEYQLNRIYSWLDPFSYAQGIGYQLKQSILAVGSGMMNGVGFDNNQVKVPESHTDFIFAIVAEEFGFLGASLLISLYFLIIFRMVFIFVKNKDKLFESLICIGMMSLISFHVFQNIGMVIGLIPITGIPLPLMSYGGSSILTTMIGFGLVLNVSLKKKDFFFSEEG
ncbi:FtsW/RodA/SpoVE family cell cycle protein [Bacillus carboniphilus]|uniref:FtsW/RodA/SpoVE family cell cycle protein n=1 Tax=Bacillus carboniphilus TaxID=86663 RepID=A0ABY9JRJ0_9BACI|nr:FtsW/RodA/SpoVE family cell cycle protein [Bacillus carboniphilus]WLR41952.1 FtsW/RodA/SpoVE family cell cycle protein [Bacillus carboniphilus]